MANLKKWSFFSKFYVANDSESVLPKPSAPTLVEARWQKIQVRFNTTELKNHSNLDYILEVKPLWGPQASSQYFVVFPYTKKYLLVSSFLTHSLYFQIIVIEIWNNEHKHYFNRCDTGIDKS